MLLALGRGLTFFADEWEVIANRPIGIDTFLRPFNEHWLGVMLTVYRGLVELIGLGSYVPYLAVLALLHVVVALEVYATARRATWPLLAAGVTIVVLFFGSGFEDLFWAMQIGFVGSVALGFGALLLVDDEVTRRRAVAATALLAISVMTSGFGLFVLALVGLDLLADPRRRRWFALVLVPAAIWLAWYLALGRTTVGIYGNPFTMDSLLRLPGFVVQGLGAAFGAAVGVGPEAGVAVAAAFGVVLVARLASRPPVPPRALTLVATIVATYALLALVRSQVEPDAASLSRYTYLTGILALLAIVTLIGRPLLPVAPRTRLAVFGGIAAVLALSVAYNGVLLVQGRELFARRADVTRALIELGLSRPLPDGVAANVSLDLVPSPDALAQIVARRGSPLADSLAGSAVAPISAAARAEALQRATHPPAWLVEAATR